MINACKARALTCYIIFLVPKHFGGAYNFLALALIISIEYKDDSFALSVPFLCLCLPKRLSRMLSSQTKTGISVYVVLVVEALMAAY